MSEFVTENLKFALKLINVQIYPLQYVDHAIVRVKARPSLDDLYLRAPLGNR